MKLDMFRKNPKKEAGSEISVWTPRTRPNRVVDTIMEPRQARRRHIKIKIKRRHIRRVERRGRSRDPEITAGTIPGTWNPRSGFHRKQKRKIASLLLKPKPGRAPQPETKDTAVPPRKITFGVIRAAERSRKRPIERPGSRTGRRVIEAVHAPAAITASGRGRLEPSDPEERNMAPISGPGSRNVASWIPRRPLRSAHYEIGI